MCIQPSEESEGPLHSNHIIMISEPSWPSDLPIINPQQFSPYPLLQHPNIERKQRVKDFSNQLIRESPKYIADNRFAVQIIQQFTNAGMCKLPQIINGKYQELQEQIMKFDKDFLQEQKSEHSINKSIFFINLQPLQIEFQDDEIFYIQSNVSNQLDFQTLESPYLEFKCLIEIINLTIRQLDPNFIPDLKLIVETYIECQRDPKNSNDTIIQNLQDKYDQFTYIQKWDEMKTRNKPVLLIYKQIKILEKRDEINDRIALKVKQKHNKKIDILQKRLYQEQILEPLEFLLKNLFEIFDQILKYYDNSMNRTIKEEEKITKKKKIEQ